MGRQGSAKSLQKLVRSIVPCRAAPCAVVLQLVDGGHLPADEAAEVCGALLAGRGPSAWPGSQARL